ncbi:MAG TPA: FAD/NAD(P)-binding oxidoreductase [Anaerolineales bacterium]|nr:FAD/NAD(P)-binding oxidoreductase [Anaerolineales bacterium]
MNGKTILILGGGVGGLMAANELGRLLPGGHRIIIVDKQAEHAFAPSFLWLMTGERRKEQITRSLHQLVRRGVEVVQGGVVSIDLANRSVKTSWHKLAPDYSRVHTGDTFHYDYLIIALGAELAPETIPGLEESAHTFYTLEGAEKLHQALQDFQGGTVAVVVSAVPYKCPGAPHEGAMLIADALRKRGLADKAEIHLFTPEPQPMPVAGPELGGAVKNMLQEKGIAFHPVHKLASVEPARRELSFEGKNSIQYDLLVAIPPHRSPQVVREAGLSNPAGWIPVDRSTLETGYENVYAVGDVTAINIPGRWKPDVPLMLPKAGVFAHAQAKVVAQRIAAEIAGGGKRSEFPGVGYCMLEAGESLAGFAFGDFFAEPSPQIELRKIGGIWHLGKVLLEQWWLAPLDLQREALRLALTLGGKALGLPIVI